MKVERGVPTLPRGMTLGGLSSGRDAKSLKGIDVPGVLGKWSSKIKTPLTAVFRQYLRRQVPFLCWMVDQAVRLIY